MQRRSTRLMVYLGSIFLFWTIAAPSAHAYIDPGSTNFIIQIVIGAAAGAGLAIATFWRRIRAFFSKKKDTTESSTAAPVASPAAPQSPSVAPPAPAPGPEPTPTTEAPATPPSAGDTASDNK